MSRPQLPSPESCWNCRLSSAGKAHHTLKCPKGIVRGPERDGCDLYKDSRKKSGVTPERGRG